MATNEQFRGAGKRSLPVPSGTKSGDPVKVGVLNGVAVTDRATTTNPAGGNADGNASVWLEGAYSFPVTGAVKAVGDPIYIANGKLAATGTTLFGAALATQTGDGIIPVEIIQPGTAASA